MSEKKKRSKIWLIVFVGVIVLFWVIGNQDSPTSTSAKGLELVESSSERGEYGNLYITGTVKNNTNKTYSYAQVTFNLYDDSGAQVGSTMANTNNLEAGGIWKFKAVVIEENVIKFKFTGIEAF